MLSRRGGGADDHVRSGRGHDFAVELHDDVVGLVGLEGIDGQIADEGERALDIQADGGDGGVVVVVVAVVVVGATIGARAECLP